MVFLLVDDEMESNCNDHPVFLCPQLSFTDKNMNSEIIDNSSLRELLFCWKIDVKIALIFYVKQALPELNKL